MQKVFTAARPIGNGFSEDSRFERDGIAGK